jgi:hypothetical protein
MEASGTIAKAAGTVGRRSERLARFEQGRGGDWRYTVESIPLAKQRGVPMLFLRCA